MKYEIIYGETLHDVQRQVNKYLKDGWRPQGGISAVNTSIVRNAQIKYIQAIIKD